MNVDWLDSLLKNNDEIEVLVSRTSYSGSVLIFISITSVVVGHLMVQ